MNSTDLSAVAPIRSSDVSATRIEQPLCDYGKLYESSAPYQVMVPSDTEEVLRIITDIVVPKRQRIRIRGSGHTFNGCTLPREDELLLRTHQLDWYCFDAPGTIRVGAGALVWDIRDLIAEHGYEMPVYNGGWAGPSLAGYICAGGFGKGSLSDEHGGLWENVLSVKLLDLTGNIHIIERDDPRFRWLFGSYGQLGIIVEATLRIIPGGDSADYPQKLEGRVPRRQLDDPTDNDKRTESPTPILFWFSLLVDPSQEKIAWTELLKFTIKHRRYVHPDGGWAGPMLAGEPIGYHYKIRFREFNPPLVYRKQSDFTVLGIMTLLSTASDDDRATVAQIEQDFIKLANDNQLGLYLQAENIGRNIDYRHYYGEQIYREFSALKAAFDPLGLLNRGVALG